MSEEFHVRDWLTEGFEGIKSKVRMPHLELMPAEFSEHMRASRKEVLLAFRSLFDSAIEKVEPKGTTTRKATKIKVES
ncbi:MAG TPA: hypothetical protein VM366_00245 [Anaerolineae bacterium]|nr:hypothetical protein [Anaerolineae bacterium]